MEKLVYLLGPPAGHDPGGDSGADSDAATEVDFEPLKGQLHGSVVPALQAAGAGHIRTCVRDAEVAPAARLRRGDIAERTWCYLSLWATSRSRHPALRAALGDLAEGMHAYVVSESDQLPRTFATDGSRVAGMNQVVCLRKPAGQDRAEFLETWLTSHTPLAIDTQATFGYLQNIVVDAIEPGSPPWDGIVEESFPAAAMTSDAAFFDAEGDELQRRIEGMINSCVRFIDLESIQVMPMSEYNF